MATPLIVEKGTLPVTGNISYETLNATFSIKHWAQQPQEHAAQFTKNWRSDY